MALFNLKDIINIVHVINTCSSLIIGIVSIFIIKKTNDKQISLMIISISSLLITILNLFTELNTSSLLRLDNISSSYYKRNFKNNSLICLIILNFLNFGSSIVFIDKLISKDNKIIEESSQSIKHLVVIDLAFIILQQLTFFSILYSFNSDNQRYDMQDPESLIMKPMRIPTKNKRVLANKSSEQTLTCDYDFMDAVNSESEEHGKQKIHNVNTNARWKRVFSTVLKKKSGHSNISVKDEEMNISFANKNLETYNNSSNINVNSQNDLHHTLSVMLDIDNNRDFLSKTNINESFERRIAAEHNAMTKMNTSLLPPRLTSKKSMTLLKGKIVNNNPHRGYNSGSRINSENSTSSNEQDLSQIPNKFHNNLQLLIENDNIHLDQTLFGKEDVASHLDRQYTIDGVVNDINIAENCENKSSARNIFTDEHSNEKKDVIDILDDFLTINKHKKNQLSLDTKSIAMVDDDMMNSAFSDDFNYSPTKSMNSLMIPKHKKTTSLSSLSPKRQQSTNTYKHKKNSQSMFINGNRFAKKSISHKLSLSNISFDIDDNGKIDFTTPYKNINNEEFNSIKTVSTTNKSNIILNNELIEDQEEYRKISDKSFDYPKVLVSEYDKEKWKNISDYT